MRLLFTLLCAAALTALIPAGAEAYNVRFEYYAYAGVSDGIPFRDDQTWTDQVYADGSYTKTGGFGNYGTVSFIVDMMNRYISVTAHSHGVKSDEWPYFGNGSGRMENADFYDRITFTAPAGYHPDGLYATMTGYVQGTISSGVGAGAQAQCEVYFGPENHKTGLLTVGIDVSDMIVVDEDFTLVVQLVAPGSTLSQDVDYVHDVRMGLWNGQTWSVDYNTGSGYVTGDGDIDFTDGLRITSLTASDGVTFVSDSGAFSDGITGVPDVRMLQLHQNAPNPFNPRTAIAFTLGEAAPVTLRVYDVGGRLIATLLDGAEFGPGRHETTWDGRDGAGRAVAAGTYFYRIDAKGSSESRPMVLVR